MAQRSSFYGAWLVDEVCRCLNELKTDLNLEDLLTRVQNQMHSSSNGGSTGQSMEVKYFPYRSFTFHKYIFFSFNKEKALKNILFQDEKMLEQKRN